MIINEVNNTLKLVLRNKRSFIYLATKDSSVQLYPLFLVCIEKEISFFLFSVLF